MGEEATRIEHLCDDVLYTTNEVAKKLKVTPKAVREWIGRGELGAINLGQGYRISQRDLDAFIEGRRKPARKKIEPASEADYKEDHYGTATSR